VSNSNRSQSLDQAEDSDIDLDSLRFDSHINDFRFSFSQPSSGASSVASTPSRGHHHLRDNSTGSNSSRRPSRKPSRTQASTSRQSSSGFDVNSFVNDLETGEDGFDDTASLAGFEFDFEHRDRMSRFQGSTSASVLQRNSQSGGDHFSHADVDFSSFSADSAPSRSNSSSFGQYAVAKAAGQALTAGMASRKNSRSHAQPGRRAAPSSRGQGSSSATAPSPYTSSSSAKRRPSERR
jgi:hypothetical protein